MSRTFSTKSGSVESLNVSVRWGCRQKARQIRCTVAADTPEARAIERVLQCVASCGRLSNVVVTTCVIRSSSIRRGAPERGSSDRPSRRASAKRRRHSATVSRVTPIRSAMATLLSPSAALKTMAARMASARPIFRRRERVSNS